jgi:FAD:protein FMN transferase
MKRLLPLLAFAALLAVLAMKSRTAPPAQLEGRAMGTSWKLAWRGQAPPAADLRREVAAALEHWEQVLSQWRPQSDLSRHNRGEPATADLARVIALADRARLETGGAFDPRLLARVHQAGFGPPGEGLDLSGIGKGFAIDRVGERLRQLGISDFIFEFGGEILAGDQPWPVAIEDPAGGIAIAIQLRQRALATSGNYHQHTARDGLLASHLIDPATGQPVLRPPASVSVTAPDCATADAWATALFVLGPAFRDYPAHLEVRWQLPPPSPP